MFTWIWGVAHRVWISLLALIPGVNLIMAVYLGIKGNELAWQKNKYLSAEDFRRSQLTWMKWGTIIVGISVIGWSVTILLAAYLAKKEEQVLARDDKRVADLQILVSKASRYKLDHNSKCPSNLEDLVPGYLEVVPLDPNGSRYILKSDGKECSISAALESVPESGSKILTREVDNLNDYIFYEE